MEAYQQRVVDEQSDLEGKVMALSQFIDGPIFVRLDPAEQERLRSQLDHMSAYNRVLERRIGAFNV